MESFDVNIEKRIAGGKRALKRLKAEGMIPGIIYTYGGSVPVSFEEYQLKDIISKHGINKVLNFTIDGNSVKAVIKEIQRNPVSREICHVDLMPLDRGILQ